MQPKGSYTSHVMAGGLKLCGWANVTQLAGVSCPFRWSGRNPLILLCFITSTNNSGHHRVVRYATTQETCLCSPACEINELELNNNDVIDLVEEEMKLVCCFQCCFFFSFADVVKWRE